jgi:ComF family protein
MGCGSLFGTDGGWLCSDCAAALIPMRESGRAQCPRCGQFLLADGACGCCAKWEGDALSLVRAAYPYARPADALVRRLKYGGVALLSDFMAEKMAETILMEHMPLPDAIVPVAMPKKRLRKRGYNQSHLLAAGIGKILRIPVLPALERRRGAKQQAGLGAQARRENMRDAFRAAADVTGMRLMLADDVFTTGATALSCAEALRGAGAAEVALIAFASAGI